jgi:hypothetical protein
MGFLGIRYVIEFIEDYGFVVLLPLYVVAIAMSCGMAAIPIAGAMLAAWALYANEVRAEQSGEENFRLHGLFFRFDQMVFQFKLPLELDHRERAVEVGRDAVAALRERLVSKLENLPILVDVVSPKNLTTSEVRPFLRILATTPAGSRHALFMNGAVFGCYLIFHIYGFARGIVRPLDRIRFICLAPLSIWFWVVPVLLRDRSLIAQIARGTRDSYDAIDLAGLQTLLEDVFIEELRAVLMEQGVLSPEVEAHIAQISNFFYDNRVSVSGSGNRVQDIQQGDFHGSTPLPGPKGGRQ